VDDAILVINAGSSSLKFALYAHRDEKLLLRGQVEGLDVGPSFRVEDADGLTLGRHQWPKGDGHAGALSFVMDWIETGASPPMTRFLILTGRVFLR